MTDSRGGEKSLCELDLNIHLYLTLNYGMASNTWNIVHKNFMVFNNVFVAFVGLNNNTIVYAQYRIWIDIPIRQKMPISELVLSRYQNFSILYQYQWKSTVLGTNFGTKAKHRNMLIMHIFINKVKQK